MSFSLRGFMPIGIPSARIQNDDVFLRSERPIHNPYRQLQAEPSAHTPLNQLGSRWQQSHTPMLSLSPNTAARMDPMTSTCTNVVRPNMAPKAINADAAVKSPVMSDVMSRRTWCQASKSESSSYGPEYTCRNNILRS